MRKFTSLTASFFALALSLSVSACNGDDTGSTASETTSGDGDGDGDASTTNTGDGDGDATTTDGSCFDQPADCQLLVECIGALFPDMAGDLEKYNADGSCWCGSTEDEAQACYETCVEQVAAARTAFPTETACHESKCSLDELDPTQPYGPVVNGACSDYVTEQGVDAPQVPINNPVNLPGSYCSPKCSGLANYCPGHGQTSAEGTCYLTVGQDNHCAMRCYVDSELIGGTQCPCGATCQPSGQDGEGNLRGLCTFE